MKTTFTLLKNGNNSETVWANPTTKEITTANRNSFGYNLLAGMDREFQEKYGCNMKSNQGKGNTRLFYKSAKSLNEAGFVLVMRGAIPLW